METPTRGLFHRRDYRGGAPPRVAGAVQKFPCTFCGRILRSAEAVQMHERDKHQILIDSAAMQLILDESFDNALPLPKEE